MRLSATGTVEARNAVAVVESGARPVSPRLPMRSGMPIGRRWVGLIRVAARWCRWSRLRCRWRWSSGRAGGRGDSSSRCGCGVVPVLIEDFATAYAAVVAGEAPRLRSEGTSVRAWTAALAERVLPRALTRSSTGWRAHRSRRLISVGAWNLLEIGCRRRRCWSTRSPPEVTAALVSTVPEAFGGHVNDALLAGLARAVQGWQQARGIEDVAPVSVLVEGHGRVDEVLETGPMGVGWI